MITPCMDCICFAICKSIITDSILGQAGQIARFRKIANDKCSLLMEYLYKNNYIMTHRNNDGTDTLFYTWDTSIAASDRLHKEILDTFFNWEER
jgi:hypothetical protein